MTKMVQLSDAAYRKLSMAKRKGESFSDVVIRITGRRRSLRDLAELGTPDEAERHLAWIREIDRMDRPDEAS